LGCCKSQLLQQTSLPLPLLLLFVVRLLLLPAQQQQQVSLVERSLLRQTTG
jgi:hypothetical protein